MKEKVGHIEDVVVDKSQRGGGIGKQMLQFLEARAKDLGCLKVILDCNSDNVGFYENVD